MSAFRIPYGVGNILGRDHSQWPTIVRSQIPDLTFTPDLTTYDNIWPVDITLAQLMALSWRVKKWSLAGTASASLSYANGGSISASVSASIPATDCVTLKFDPILGVVAATKELDLIGTLFSYGYRTSAYTSLGNYTIGPVDGSGVFTPVVAPWSSSYTDGSGTYTDSGNTSLGTGILGLWPTLYDPVTKLFSPSFNDVGAFDINAHAAPVSGVAFVFGLAFRRSPITVASMIGPGALEAPGTFTVISHIAPDFVVPLQLGWHLVFEGIGSTSSGSGSGAFTLEATEFWPYQNSLGQPVYDVTTGAQINDPFA